MLLRLKETGGGSIEDAFAIPSPATFTWNWSKISISANAITGSTLQPWKGHGGFRKRTLEIKGHSWYAGVAGGTGSGTGAPVRS
jgi:hypothetical protein